MLYFNFYNEKPDFTDPPRLGYIIYEEIGIVVINDSALANLALLEEEKREQEIQRFFEEFIF